jgi:hypothetical protein
VLRVHFFSEVRDTVTLCTREKKMENFLVLLDLAFPVALDPFHFKFKNDQVEQEQQQEQQQAQSIKIGRTKDNHSSYLYKSVPFCSFHLAFLIFFL